MNLAIKTRENLVGEAERAAGAPPAEAEAWSTSVFAALTKMLGETRVNGIALRFQTDLQNRFADLDDRETLIRDAHTITSTAGMLGFVSLSAAARSFETACVHGGNAEASLSDLLRCRQTASELLTRHFQAH